MAFVSMIADGSLPRAYLSTLQPLVIGVVALGRHRHRRSASLMGLRPGAEWLAAPVFIVLQAAPVAALIPLVTFVYGIGMAAKTLAVMLLALPVIVLNCYKAVRNVNPSLVDMCRSFLGTRRQQIAKIILPDASPVIFAGLRLGVAAGFVGVVLAELLITPTGIGDLITYPPLASPTMPRCTRPSPRSSLLSTLTLTALQWLEIALFRPEKKGSLRWATLQQADAATPPGSPPIRRHRRGARHRQDLRRASRRCATSISTSRAAS